MARDTERSRLFTRRAVLLGSAKIGLFSILAGRIYYLQLAQGDKYRTMAEDNRINLRLISPPRGQILDRSGAALAINQQNYRVVLLPEQVDKLDVLLEGINTYVPLTETDRKRIERDFKNNSGFNAVMVRDNLNWDQVAIISLHTLDLPGVDIEVGEVRYYPYTDAMAHVMGYVGAVAQAEVDDDQPELAIPGFRIGKNGVEKQYDMELRGSPGSVQLEVNAHGRVVRELAHNDPHPGADVSLTIDISLQDMMQKRLVNSLSAAAVVMDVQTGAIYGLVSYPGFDPNLFTYGISQEDWSRLRDDEYTPLLNKAIGGQYAPGSTFKIITSLAGLEGKVLVPEATTYCPGYLDLGNHRFHCWKHGGHGNVNFMQAMAGSCDTYFYDLGKRVGIDRIQAMAKRFGMGQKLEIDLPHERAGLIPGSAWKQAILNSPWQQGETLITAIGQGYVLTTPLQLVMMMARLTNGGLAVKPHLTKRVGAKDFETKSAPSMGIPERHLKLVREALVGVTKPGGTAYGSRILDEKMAMGGKTGTAQVRRITMADRADGLPDSDDVPWKERDHALFVGFAPVENPRYAVSVVVEHGGHGASVAAPVARDILIECQKRGLGN